MIYKESDMTIAQYGNGTIFTTVAELGDSIGLALIPTDEREIGESCTTITKGTNLHENGAEILLMFSKKESFDIFYEQVLALKNEFDKKDKS